MTSRSAQYVSKDPDSVLDYETDWTTWMAEGDSIASSEWLIPTEPDDALVEDSSSFTDTVAVVWLSGGTLGQRYTIVNRIVTAQGRTEDRQKFVTITPH